MTTTTGGPGRTTAALTADAVLLDLDSTLVNSLPSLIRSWSQWAEEHALTPAQVRAALGHGLTAAAIVARLLPPERRAAGLARVGELETADVADVTALPGAKALVAALPPDRWAIVTSGNQLVARARLRAAGLPEPTVLVTADDVGRGKPDPEPYLLGARRVGADPARCLVVEDAPAGLAAARAAGMRAIGVTTTHPAADLDADVVVEGLQNLRVELDGAALTIVVNGEA
ncbi:HAD-IA family hydrolase [Actinopolymorpha sp. B17G11]|uniref:HAD-IA family hydrolase n=1 Tax=unclassified Actinopolymorpha TaxID=2627063 RepID=UPI0032D9A84E